MSDNSSDSPLLVRMLNIFVEPATCFLDADTKTRVAKAIGIAAAAGVELDQMKDAPEETIESFFDSWKMQNNTRYLSRLLHDCNCRHASVFLVGSRSMTRQFLILRDSINEYQLGVAVKCAMDLMDFENLRALLSNKSVDSGVEIRRRFFAQQVLEKIKYLYPNLYFPALFGLYIDSDPFSFNDVFPLEILDKPYMLVLSQYGKCEASHFEKNLLCKLLSEEHQEVIEQLYGQRVDGFHCLGGYFAERAVAKSLECNLTLLLDINKNSKCNYRVASLMTINNDKVFEMLLRAISANIQDKYSILYNLSKDFPDSRAEMVLAQLAVDTSKGLILDERAYDRIELAKYRNHYEICQEQVKWMKSVVIFETVTLLDALDYDTEDLAEFVGLKDNIQNLLAKCKEEKLIDYYYSSLEEQLYTAIAVQDTRARAAKFIERATGICIILVIDKIMSYLSLKDLRFFALPIDPKF